jgi:hypothetical protein
MPHSTKLEARNPGAAAMVADARDNQGLWGWPGVAAALKKVLEIGEFQCQRQ